MAARESNQARAAALGGPGGRGRIKASVGAEAGYEAAAKEEAAAETEKQARLG